MKNDLGSRMKRYEQASKYMLTHRTPVIIRLDGVAFHTFTKGFMQPFDTVFRQAMKDTMLYLCEHIMGCVLGYTQSDEITLVLCDYKKLTSQAWFDNEVQKMASVSASMATMTFNQAFVHRAYEAMDDSILSSPYWDENTNGIKQGMFDSRCFNIPVDDVYNCLLWRQRDATKNSIQSVAQYKFSLKEVKSKTCDELQDMLFTRCDINWNDYPVYLKRGVCCIRQNKIGVTLSGKTHSDIL